MRFGFKRRIYSYFDECRRVIDGKINSGACLKWFKSFLSGYNRFKTQILSELQKFMYYRITGIVKFSRVYSYYSGGFKGSFMNASPMLRLI